MTMIIVWADCKLNNNAVSIYMYTALSHSIPQQPTIMRVNRDIVVYRLTSTFASSLSTMATS